MTQPAAGEPRRDSTEPVTVAGAPGGVPEDAERSRRGTGEWSFGPVLDEAILAPGAVERLAPSQPAAAANDDPWATFAPQRIDVPGIEASKPPRRAPNKRSMRALTRWEGIVERFTPDGFVARLIRYRDGAPDYSKPEFSQFSWDELNLPRDADHVDEGSVFYWAVVRRTNEAGTQYKTTDLRFKKVPPISREQEERARGEAAEILEKFGKGLSNS